MFGKFEVLRGQNEQFYFVLKAKNGEIIATSELYKTRSSALKGINAVKKCIFASVEYKTDHITIYKRR